MASIFIGEAKFQGFRVSRFQSFKVSRFQSFKVAPVWPETAPVRGDPSARW
jgi:hypothetical protein